MKLSNGNIEIRTSTLTSAVKCRLQTLLKICESIEGVDSDSPQLQLGRTVHTEIQKTLQKESGVEFNDILDHPHPKVDDELPSKVILGGPRIGNYKELKDGVILYNRSVAEFPTRDVTIRELLHKKMFGVEIEHIEYPMEYTWNLSGKTLVVPKTALHREPDPSWEKIGDYGYLIKIEDFKVKLTGTLDFASKNGEIIGDWKTSATTPQEAPMCEHVNYYKQLAIYKWLWCKMNNMPLDSFYGILVYLVKTKTPKICLRPFRITDLYLQETETLIDSVFEDLMLYMSTGIYPRYSIGSCSYCSVHQKCELLNRKLPRAIKLSDIEIV